MLRTMRSMLRESITNRREWARNCEFLTWRAVLSLSLFGPRFQFDTHSKSLKFVLHCVLFHFLSLSLSLNVTKPVQYLLGLHDDDIITTLPTSTLIKRGAKTERV